MLRSRPVMGIVQDTLCGARLFTRRDTFLDRQTMMHILMFYGDWDGKIPMPAVLKPKPLWTGKQLFSMLIDDKINMERHHKPHMGEESQTDLREMTVHDTRVLVERGVVISGTICKATLGASGGGLLHLTRHEAGVERTRLLYSNIQLMVNNWLVGNGVSIGVADTVADKRTFEIIEELLEDANKKVVTIIKEAYEGGLAPTPGNTIRQTFENKVNKELNSAREKTGKRAAISLSDFNGFKSLLTAGSKGSPLNISQIVACVGQQNVVGKRIPFGFHNRSLPHFCKDDYGPLSRGFVFSSYLKGLTPAEFFFHAMGGREGLIDTAVKTAETGYIQRRLVKSMEGVSLYYDGSVRNCNGELVQLLYGEDGMSGEFLEHQEIKMIKASTKKFEEMYDLSQVP